MSAAIDTAHLEQDQGSAVPSTGEQERQRGLSEFFKEAWSQALVAVNAAEEETQKILSRMTSWFEVGPEEARRLGLELTEKLRRERNELEESIEVAVRRALTPFRLPSRDDLNVLHARLTELEARVDRAIALRSSGASASESTIAQ